MKSLPVLADSENCTGCAACADVCSKNAITMEYNSEGFLEPFVDEAKCSGCNACQKVCPAFSVCSDNVTEPDVFVCYASDKDILKKSSSGGVFPLLAKKIISEGGAVCGAVFDDDFSLRHVIVSSQYDLEKLYGSKYLQSNTEGCWKKIRELLENGKKVLFCGTPCEVAALNNFLKKQYDTLISVDLLCHGVPSPLLFKRYLKEQFSGKKIKSYKFRNKVDSGWKANENVWFSNGKFLKRTSEDSPWFNAFISCWSTRKSCSSCKYASLPRQGDFTLGDAWDIENLKPEYYSDNGVSVVALNSHNAEKLFSEIKSELSLCEKVPLDWLKTHGQPFDKPFKSSSPSFFRDRFFQLLKRKSFDDALFYTKRGAFDIAIMGVWFGWNYGSILTYYSLYNFLVENGYLVLMIEKTVTSKNDMELNPEFHSRKFAINHYKDRIGRLRPVKDLNVLNMYADTFILGADQVLHNNVLSYFKNTQLLGFTEQSKKRIMYASSFGHETDSNPPEMRGELKKLFDRFDAIGLREQSGVKIMNKNYGIKKARTVLDSVFLSDVDFYIKIASESKCSEEKPFLLAYILDPSPAMESVLKGIVERHDLSLVLILDGNIFHAKKLKKENNILSAKENVEAQDFVWYFMHSQFVITDSFHGTCFSIIFKKQFVTIANKNRGAVRFLDLLNPLKLSGRMIESETELLPEEKFFDNQIDWEGVYKILNKKINDSRSFLLASVEKKKRRGVFSKKNGNIFSRLRNCFSSAYSHILKINNLEEKVSSLTEKISRLEKKLDGISEAQEALMMRTPTNEELSGFNQSEILKSYNRARIDIKNCGSDENTVTVVNSYVEDTSFWYPDWFANKHGLVCRGTSGKMTFEIKCVGDGELKFFLRGPDVRDSNNKRYPVWINHTCFFVNGKSVLPGPKSVWHDEPFIYSLKVSDSEKILIHTEWQLIF